MITFNNIVERFKIFADAHFFVKSFSFGSPDDVDLSKFTSFPLMHLVYTGATYDAGTKTYNLEVYILDVPADKTKKTDRQKEVVSDAEQCAEDIIADIKNGGNIFLFAQDYEVVNATTTPLEEETKNVLSGVLLDLSVAIPYEWDACNAPIDGVTPEGGDEVPYARRGILRMLTQNGSTDVLSVRTIKVSNGTLTDEGDGVVSLDTAGAESLDELTDVYLVTLENNQIIQYQAFSLPGSPAGWKNKTLDMAALSDTKGTPVEGHLLKYTGGFWQPSTIDLNDLDGVTVTSPQTGNVLQYSSTFGWYNTNLPAPAPPPSTTDQLPEGTTNLYYTEARVSANADVTANTAKVGITAQQAADILNNNAKVSLIAGGTTGQALVKTSGTDYDVQWADISIDVQYHNRYQSESETLRAGGAETIELYYSAQADGDGLAESASSDTPAAGYDIRRKLYYSEAGFADPDTGTWTQFTAIADNTTFANAKAALLAYLKERTGGTVPISLKMTWEEVAQAPAFTGLLNESYGSGAEAAYSTRRLNGNYSGDCMTIRRASDGTTQSIGFVGEEIDESAIETFCSGTTCTVQVWRDQSGNGNDATQTTPANQPTIYTGGALVKEKGRLTVDFNSDFFALSDLTFTAVSIYSAVQVYTNSGLLQNTTTDNDALISFYVNTQTRSRFSGVTQNWSTNNDEVFRLVTYENDTTNAPVLRIDSNAQTVLSGAITGSNTVTVNSIGGNGFLTSDANYNMSEMIVYDAVKSTADRTSIESNIGDYYTQNTPLLDTYSGAAAAYSLRKLRTAYTGSAIRVRRSNDNAETDIGFNVFGELDTVSLAAHCGSNDGFVKTWYCQSGNANDATQSTTANQPKIYDGSTGVVTENGKPAVEFDGTNDLLDSTGLSETTLTTFHVARPNQTNSEDALFSLVGSQANGFFRYSSTGKMTAAFNGGFSTTTSYAAAQNLVYALFGTSLAIGYNGATAETASATGRTSTGVRIGVKGADYFTGKTQELVVYPSDKTSNRTNIEDNINTFYDIY